MHTEATLNTLRLPELQGIYTELTGDLTKCPNRKWLIRHILAAQGGKAPETATTPEAPVAAPTPRRKAKPAPTAAALAEPPKARAKAMPAPKPAPVEPEPEATLVEPEIIEPAPRVSIADRVTQIRAIDSIAALDALMANPGWPLQAVVLAEANKQREALASVIASSTTEDVKATLTARLANRPSHTRPGVGALIRRVLEGMGVEASTEQPLAALFIDELRTRYTEVVGRPTGSDHRGYLIWKIREAMKGKVTVGAVKQGAKGTGKVAKVIPLSLDVDAVVALDGARVRLGFSSRNAMIREAVAGLLEAKGEGEAAAALRA